MIPLNPEQRQQVLWWEICSLLHDVGKLSDEFLYYRQRWHKWPRGYMDKDPHDHNWMSQDRLLNSAEFTVLREFFKKILVAGTPGSALSIENAIQNHMLKGADPLVQLLRLGDGADSRYDRNNPLIGCEQLDGVFRSNVFGYESDRTRVSPGVPEKEVQDWRELKFTAEGTLNAARRELYRDLQNALPGAGRLFGSDSWDRFRKIRESMAKYFEPALSDTTRPGNDTSLWEHVYSVASITKALHIQTMHDGSTDRVLGEGNAHFRIWGFGFDALRYISFGHKIGDVLGRRNVLQRIFGQVRKILEYDLPLGNRVYQDDSYGLYLVPPLSRDIYEGELAERIARVSVEESEGELVPRFTISDQTVTSLTEVVARLDELRMRTGNPVGEGAALIARRFGQGWHGRSTCSVCRMRPAKQDDENKRYCGVCLGRRTGHTEGFSLDGEASRDGTPMLSEIADGNGRVALIVARFGLREWLDGQMVRSCLVTEPEGIRATAQMEVKEFEGRPDQQRNAWFGRRPGNGYAQMLRELGECRKGQNDEAVFVYGRDLMPHEDRLVYRNVDWKGAEGVWLADWRQAQREPGWSCASDEPSDADLLGLVCGKTPTPSTVLDVWDTTREFLKSITDVRRAIDGSEEEAIIETIQGLEAKGRTYIEVEAAPAGRTLGKHETIAARVDGVDCEAVSEEGGLRYWVVDGPSRHQFAEKAKFKSLQIRRDADEDFCELLPIRRAAPKPKAYYPYRLISRSPDLLLLLVPAAQAIDVTRAIYERYLLEFGKVYGRLPFSIGNIFFQDHLPMFSVLDAAWRMQRNFDRLHCERQLLRGPAPATLREEWMKLGNGATDYHHPYLRTADMRSELAHSFVSVPGPVAHMTEIGSGDDVLTRPNYYDCEFLGASADRFHLHLDLKDGESGADEPWHSREDLRKMLRRGEHGGPILLDELGEVVSFWEKLRARGVTDTQVRNFEQAVQARRTAWRAQGEAGEAQSLALADDLAPHYFGFGDLGNEVRRAVRSGLMFRALDLYWRILKERLGS